MPLELLPRAWHLPTLLGRFRGTPILKEILTRQGYNLSSPSSKEAVTLLNPGLWGRGQLDLLCHPCSLVVILSEEGDGHPPALALC